MSAGIGGWLVRTGALVLVLGPIPALFGALELVAIPVLAIVAHVAMMITGVLFMCLGFGWPDKHLSPREGKTAFALLLGGCYGAIAAVIIGALVGIGGEALAAIPGGIVGPPNSEMTLKVVFGASGLAVVIALALVGYGSVRATRATRAAAGFGERDGYGEASTSRSVRLFQVGLVLFGAGVLSAVVTGLLGFPGLGMATHVGVVVFGLFLMGTGHILPEVEGLTPRAEQAVFWLLIAGAVGIVVTGGLARGDSVLDVFFTGFIGSGSGVQLFALLTVLATAFGALTIWHGLPEAGPPTSGALKRPEDMPLKAIRLGIVLVVFGLVAAFFTGLTRVPRVAVGTWGTMLIIGPMLMCFGLLWREAEEMTEDRQRSAYGFLWWGSVGILVSGMVLALLGIGGDTLGFSAAGYEGSESAELIAKVAVDLSVLVMAIGLFLVWRGTRAPTEESVLNRATRIAYYVLFVLILQTAFYHVLPNIYFADSYPVRLVDYDMGHADTVVWIDGAGMTWTPAQYSTAPVEANTLGAGATVDAVQRAQGWTHDDWLWFYHASQGGAFELPVPYDWMMALEQPIVRLWPRSEAGLLMSSDYLAGFGFLPNDQRYFAPCNVSIELGRVGRILAHEAIDSTCDRVIYENNPDRLPVGFTKVENWIDHGTGQTIDAMGFTCAACHTGQLDYRKADDSLPGDTVVWRVRIEGGPANVDLGTFRIAVAQSLLLTKALPRRFERFADRLDDIRRARAETVDPTFSTPFVPVDRERLREDLDALLERGGELREVQESIYPTPEGFARLDAIGRIANYVFSNDLQMEENLDTANAPVNFPYVWDAPKLEWVQYNASFAQPMMRNAGQSMGVFASVDLEGAGRSAEVEEDALLFSSSIDLLNIHDMETLIGGCPAIEPNGLESRCRAPFTGLESPRWPAGVFGPLDMARVRRGRSLYERYCSSCHGTYSEDVLRADSTNWVRHSRTEVLPSGDTVTYSGEYVRVRVHDLWDIGTDPLAAVNFLRRDARLGELGARLEIEENTLVGAEALATLITRVKERRYQDLGLDLPEDSVDVTRDDTVTRWLDTVALLRAELDGYRGPDIQAVLGYRARPLNGVWATPPFLHNGSVPTLYQLLSPQEERPERFYLGSRLFDPVYVGLDYHEVPGASEFDTSLPGNSNQGHSFEGDSSDSLGKRGVVGPELSHQERLDLIEYLKLLPPLPPRPDSLPADPDA